MAEESDATAAVWFDFLIELSESYHIYFRPVSLYFPQPTHYFLYNKWKPLHSSSHFNFLSSSIINSMTIPLNTPAAVDVEIPRPKDVGVLAMEVYFPRRVRLFHLP